MKKVQTFPTKETGATAIEYALIAALIAIVIVTTVGLAGGALTEAFQRVSDMF